MMMMQVAEELVEEVAGRLPDWIAEKRLQKSPATVFGLIDIG